MALYEYRCVRGHEEDVSLPMGTAPNTLRCPNVRLGGIPAYCGLPAVRLVGLFQHTEDRRHMGQESISQATGLPKARSRAEKRAIEKALDIEFISPGDMPGRWKRALEYKEHVDTGGERLDPRVVMPDEVPVLPPLTDYMDAANFRFDRWREPEVLGPEQAERKWQDRIAAIKAREPKIEWGLKADGSEG